jgi:hypothetical protein
MVEQLSRGKFPKAYETTPAGLVPYSHADLQWLVQRRRESEAELYSVSSRGLCSSRVSGRERVVMCTLLFFSMGGPDRADIQTRLYHHVDYFEYPVQTVRACEY